jgi:addiction module RelE/StbE family toxin
MTHVLYAQSAQTDLLEAWLFIAEENMPAADRTIETIENEAETLSLQPKMGRTRPELGKDVRSWPTSTPYVLFYQVSQSNLTVLRVLHHARDIGQQLF